MAHFAKLDSNNIVTQVLVVGNNDLIKKEWWDPLGLFTGKKESEKVGIAFCQNHCGDPNSKWAQTSYNAVGGKPGDGERSWRGNYAGIGFTYMTGVRTMGVASTDIFIGQRPIDMNGELCESWSIGVGTACWYPPDGVLGFRDMILSIPLAERDAGMIPLWSEDNYKKDPSTAWVIVNEFTYYDKDNNNTNTNRPEWTSTSLPGGIKIDVRN